MPRERRTSDVSKRATVGRALPAAGAVAPPVRGEVVKVGVGAALEVGVGVVFRLEN